MRNVFLDHLVSNKRIDDQAAAQIERWLRHAPQPIGMIAMSHGLLSGPGIDEVLQRQSDTQEKFGEIAVKMALLTPGQVERLLDVQRFRRCSMVVEGLVLSGQMSVDEATECFADFLHEPTVAAVVAGE